MLKASWFKIITLSLIIKILAVFKPKTDKFFCVNFDQIDLLQNFFVSLSDFCGDACQAQE